MKKLLLIVLIFTFSACSKEVEKNSMSDLIETVMDISARQYFEMANKLESEEGRLPRTYENGEFKTSDSRWWTSGFFPGTLWYLYEYTNNDDLLRYAKLYTQRVEREKYTTDNHDVGFMLYCSFGNGLRIIGEESYKEVLLTGAKSLSTRYNEKIQLIRSWDFNKHLWQYPVIIDNMMNLELMFWASKESGDPFFTELSVAHADKTINHHYRDDYSCYHVVSYDTISGEPHIKQTFQGYNDESAWARGQAWGLYGYVVMYRETKQQKYLDHAINIADFIINHPSMPEDMIPYWDFNAPNIPDAKRDASAGAIIASALIELSDYNLGEKSKNYIKVAENQLKALASEAYLARPGENGNFILRHSVGHLPGNSEVDVPLTYADYYFIEALLRWKQRFL
ncbi:MAG: glycoside hydrolase family 88 protein [Cyclobacteriaceae bacterium]|nr:glycoside hydrolase family 88 protein [Cyclobacteriaceae bacterium]